MYLHLAATVLTALILFSPALADESGGTKYFVRNPERQEPPKPSTLLRSKDIRSKASVNKSNDIAAEDAAQAAWANYKAFASGQPPSAVAAPKAAAPKIVTPKRPTKPVVSTPAAKADPSTPASQTGIAGLLQQYQSKQEKRSQMNTLNIRKPVEPSEKAK